MQVLSGAPIAERIIQETRERIGRSGVRPGLAVILVGEDKPSQIYVGIKERRAREIGVEFERLHLPQDASESELLFHIRALNDREDIHGIVLQLPLPGALDPDVLIGEIEPEKDTDGFHPATLEKYLAGDKTALPVFPGAVRELILASGVPLEERSALALGNSTLFLDVMRSMLAGLGTHAETLRMSDLDTAASGVKLGRAEIVVTASGQPHFLKAGVIPKATVVVDGGITARNGKVLGDVDPETFAASGAWLTPVPGGVGPVTVAMLLSRVTDAALRAAGLPESS